MRDNHNKHAEERKFLEEQIILAVEAKLKLERRCEELGDELGRLEEEEGVGPQERIGSTKLKSAEQVDKEYYENTRKKLSDHMK